MALPRGDDGRGDGVDEDTGGGQLLAGGLGQADNARLGGRVNRETAAPAPPPAGWSKHPLLPVHSHTAVIGGMPGWQITLIAIGAAIFPLPWP